MPSSLDPGGSQQHAGKSLSGWLPTCLLLFSACLPAIAAMAVLGAQPLHLPYQDDYHAILEFAVNYEQLHGVGPKMLNIAAEQHNEYKLVLEHAIIASELEATHHLNFGFLTNLGNLFLLPMGYLLWLIYREDGPDRLLAFLPISFLFFSLTYWPNQNWAMTGLQNTPVVFFSLLAIFLVAPRDPRRLTGVRLLLACGAAALAAFTSANGFLLGPVGLLLFVPRRAYGRALLWCASFVLPLAAYLYHFASVAHPLSRLSYATRPLFFLAFLGTVVGFRWPAAILGVIILAIVLLAVRVRYDRINPAAAYLTLWVLLTAGLVAWVRGGFAFTIGSRYAFYSNLMVIFCYAFLAYMLPVRWPAFNRRAFYAGATVMAALFCGAVDVHAWTKLAERRQMVVTGIELFRERPEVNSPMIDPVVLSGVPSEVPYERGVLVEAIQRGVYALPPKP